MLNLCKKRESWDRETVVLQQEICRHSLGSGGKAGDTGGWEGARGLTVVMTGDGRDDGVIIMSMSHCHLRQTHSDTRCHNVDSPTPWWTRCSTNVRRCWDRGLVGYWLCPAVSSRVSSPHRSAVPGQAGSGQSVAAGPPCRAHLTSPSSPPDNTWTLQLLPSASPWPVLVWHTVNTRLRLGPAPTPWVSWQYWAVSDILIISHLQAGQAPVMIHQNIVNKFVFYITMKLLRMADSILKIFSQWIKY